MARTNNSSDQPKAGTAWSGEAWRCAIAYDKEQQEKLESSKIRINALMRRDKASFNTRRRDWFMFILFKANANL